MTRTAARGATGGVRSRSTAKDVESAAPGAAEEPKVHGRRVSVVHIAGGVTLLALLFVAGFLAGSSSNGDGGAVQPNLRQAAAVPAEGEPAHVKAAEPSPTEAQSGVAAPQPGPANPAQPRHVRVPEEPPATKSKPAVAKASPSPAIVKPSPSASEPKHAAPAPSPAPAPVPAPAPAPAPVPPTPDSDHIETASFEEALETQADKAPCHGFLSTVRRGHGQLVVAPESEGGPLVPATLALTHCRLLDLDALRQELPAKVKGRWILFVGDDGLRDIALEFTRLLTTRVRARPDAGTRGVSHLTNVIWRPGADTTQVSFFHRPHFMKVPSRKPGDTRPDAVLLKDTSLSPLARKRSGHPDLYVLSFGAEHLMGHDGSLLPLDAIDVDAIVQQVSPFIRLVGHTVKIVWFRPHDLARTHHFTSDGEYHAYRTVFRRLLEAVEHRLTIHNIQHSTVLYDMSARAVEAGIAAHDPERPHVFPGMVRVDTMVLASSITSLPMLN